jgi:hypothetical protein
VALRRQQAQEETEARQLGVELLKPGDRAELVMGTEGIMARQEVDKLEEEEERDYRRKVNCEIDQMGAAHQGEYYQILLIIMQKKFL